MPLTLPDNFLGAGYVAIGHRRYRVESVTATYEPGGRRVRPRHIRSVGRDRLELRETQGWTERVIVMRDVTPCR